MKVFTSEVEMLRAQCKEWEKVCDQHLRHIKKLKAQRTWVDLTDDDIDGIYQGAGKNDLKRAREVLAAFKEKNT